MSQTKTVITKCDKCGRTDVMNNAMGDRPFGWSSTTNWGDFCPRCTIELNRVIVKFIMSRDKKLEGDAK